MCGSYLDVWELPYFSISFQKIQVFNWTAEGKGTQNRSLNFTITLFSNSSNQHAWFRSWQSLAIFAFLRCNAM